MTYQELRDKYVTMWSVALDLASWEDYQCLAAMWRNQNPGKVMTLSRDELFAWGIPLGFRAKTNVSAVFHTIVMGEKR